MIVQDDGSPDPFATDPAAVMTRQVDGAEPRLVVREGLEFGRSYAWKVIGRPAAGRAPQEGPIWRFTIEPLPDILPELRVSRPDPGEMQPGLTLFNVRGFFTFEGGLALVVDENGNVVFFRHRPDIAIGIGYIERMESGRLTMLRGLATGIGMRATEETLDGQILWQSPGGRGYAPHHDVQLMPEGDLLIILRDRFTHPSGVAWTGDRLIVLNRQTMEEMWSWRARDHFSLLDGEAVNPRDWTHGNAAFYHPPHDSIYYCVRHLSRITRIDYATGEIVYNMGRDQPSGETDFGHGLFSFQHAPELLPGGNMLIFDNANLSNPRHSRAVELAFDDPDAPTAATEAWSYTPVDDAGAPIFSPAGGDVDRLPNGNTLITASRETTVFEVTADGRLVWKLEIIDFPMAGPPYRSQRLASLIVDAPGDSDGDGDLDLHDLAGLQIAFGSPENGELQFPESLSDYDGNGVVDGHDVDRFSHWMSGPARTQR
jgi:hypothetical protein